MIISFVTGFFLCIFLDVCEVVLGEKLDAS